MSARRLRLAPHERRELEKMAASRTMKAGEVRRAKVILRLAEKPASQKIHRKGAIELVKNTAREWMEDKCPQLGAALAYFSVFSLAPLVVVLLAVFGLIFGSSEHARDKITEQLQYFVDPSGIKVIKDIATRASEPKAGFMAATIGVIVGLFGASGVFGQLQDSLNTIWGVKPKPGAGLMGFIRARFLSFSMVGGVCFLLLASLTVEGLLRGFNDYLKAMVPGGHILAMAIFLLRPPRDDSAL
jgi:membrane protein